MSRRNHLFMVRPKLDGAPDAPLADGFAIRTYRPGDEMAWAAIVRAALDHTCDENAFAERIASDEEFLPERVFFALHGDRPVGSAAAFRKTYYGDRTGYVHMLAVLPAYHGMGLGAALLAACLDYFERRGWRDAVLDTDADRLPAIRLYLAFGFEPVPETPDEFALWKKALAALDRPDLAAGLKFPPP